MRCAGVCPFPCIALLVAPACCPALFALPPPRAPTPQWGARQATGGVVAPPSLPHRAPPPSHPTRSECCPGALHTAGLPPLCGRPSVLRASRIQRRQQMNDSIRQRPVSPQPLTLTRAWRSAACPHARVRVGGQLAPALPPCLYPGTLSQADDSPFPPVPCPHLASHSRHAPPAPSPYCLRPYYHAMPCCAAPVGPHATHSPR